MKPKGLGLTIAIGKPKGPPSSEKMSPDDEDDMGVSDEDVAPSEEEVAAADELLAAVKASNARLVAIAFKNMKNIC